MLDSLRKLKVSVSADSQQISDKSCVEWTGIGTSSQDTPHIHKQYGCILRSGHRNQHRLPRNAGIHLGEYRAGRNMTQNTGIAPDIVAGDHRQAGQQDPDIFRDASF